MSFFCVCFKIYWLHHNSGTYSYIKETYMGAVQKFLFTTEVYNKKSNITVLNKSCFFNLWKQDIAYANDEIMLA